MKKNIVAIMLMSLMIVGGSAAPAFSFDFIKTPDQYVKKTVFPLGTSLGAKNIQFINDLNQNRLDFLDTHPGTTGDDFYEARRTALHCNLPGSQMAYVTDGHQGTYYPKMPRTALSGGWEDQGFTACGSSIVYGARREVVINNTIGTEIVVEIVVDIIEDLSTGTLTGAVTTPAAHTQFFYNVRSLDDMMSYLTLSANTQLGADTIIVTRAGIAQTDTDIDDSVSPNAWMEQLATIIGLDSAEWRSAGCVATNRMFIDYNLDRHGNLDHAYFTIIKRPNGLYELYEFDSLAETHPSALDIADALNSYRG